MENISKIRSLSLWVFLIPLFTVNLCLMVVIFFQEYIPHGVGIAPTFPYFDGGTSISRTARTFPTYLIFKPGMIITSFLLIKYWMLNKNLLSNIEPLNILEDDFQGREVIDLAITPYRLAWMGYRTVKPNHEDAPVLEKNFRHNIDVVVDRPSSRGSWTSCAG